MILHKLTYHATVKQLAATGTWIVVAGVLLMYILSAVFGNHYIWIMPGITLYFLGIGICYGPLMRLTLFSTSIVKGTAAALMCMVSMCIQAFGLELFNIIYAHHSHLLLSLYCLITGLLLLSCFLIFLAKRDTRSPEPSI